jgi:transcriptional regulator with XRE-family HTH domain
VIISWKETLAGICATWRRSASLSQGFGRYNSAPDIHARVPVPRPPRCTRTRGSCSWGWPTHIPALPFARARLKASWHSAAYPKELKHLCDHLQKRRLDLGLTWKAAAEEMDIDSTTLTNWTKRRTQPDLRCLPRIVRWLGYDPLPEARSVGQALVRHRQVRGLSQRQLADILRVDPSTLGRWERDERTPVDKHLACVEDLLRDP